MNEGKEAQMNPVGGSGFGVGVGGAGGAPQHQTIQDIADLIAGMDQQFEMLRIEQPMQDMPGFAGMDQEFEMLRTTMREKIYEYIERKQMMAEWCQRLPKLAMRLEEVLFSKFSNKNDYYVMMKGPLEPQLQFAIRTLSAQNQQNYQNRQMSRQLAPTSGYGTIILTAGMTLGTTGNKRIPYVLDKNALSSSVPGIVPQDAGMSTSMLENVNFQSPQLNHKQQLRQQQHQVQHNSQSVQNQYDLNEHQRNPDNQAMHDVVGLVDINTQFVMLRNNMYDKIFEYIGKKQMTAEWQRRLPQLARRLEEILFTKFSNKNEYYNMMEGPIEPQLQFAIKTLSALNQQNLHISRHIASSSCQGT